MQLWTLAFLLGNSLTLFCKNLPSATLFVLLLIIAVSLAIIFRKKYSITLLLAVAIGFSWFGLHAALLIKQQLPKYYEAKTISITGIITNIPELHYNNNEFEFLIYTINQQKINPLHIRLNWHSNTPLNLHIGDQWQLQARLKHPRGFWDLGSFDYQAWLFEHKIRATGYVVGSSTNTLLGRNSYYAPINHLREGIANYVTKSLGDKPLVGLINALTTGVRYQITEDQWRVMRGTGTNHLFAIAGLHIGFITTIIYFLVNFSWRRLYLLPLYVPTPHAAAFASLLAAIFYSALAGFSLPTQRAIIMTSVFLFAVLTHRNLLSWTSWNLALLMVLIIEPLALLSDSFWLSFGAVAIIVYGTGGRLTTRNKLWHSAYTQWVIAIGLIPLSLLFFQEFSLANFIANAIAIPWVGFIVLPICLSGVLVGTLFPTIGSFLLFISEKILALIWPLLSTIANTQFLQWHITINNPLVFISAMIAVLLLLAPKGLPGRWLSWLWLLPLFLYKPAGPAAKEVWFTLLDVGQGLAAIVQTQHHILVYDTGPKFNANFDTGNAAVLPYLHYMGINKIDVLMISHPDNDHIGGAYSILAKMPVNTILTSAPEKFNANIANLCLAGQQWEWDGVKFQIIYPDSNKLHLDNDSSCVLRIDNGTQSILLTGDIERNSEEYLVQNALDLLPATILVAPHHGSITSSTLPFVNAVKPSFVLFPVGYLNRFHFPNPKIISRYQAVNAKIYDTIKDGMILFKLTNNAILSTTTYKKYGLRFWDK